MKDPVDELGLELEERLLDLLSWAQAHSPEEEPGIARLPVDLDARTKALALIDRIQFQRCEWDLRGHADGDQECIMQPDKPESAASPGTALVVEDDEPIRALVVGYLREAGWLVTEALSAEAALAAWRVAESSDQGFDLAVLDNRIPTHWGLPPVPHGLAMAEVMRDEARVVVYSGDDIREGCDALGVEFVGKGDPKELRRVLLEGGGEEPEVP